MRQPVRLLLGVLIVCGAFPPKLVSQTGGDLRDRAVQAYTDLDFDEAVSLLRLWFVSARIERLAPAEVATALAYLGAAELFRGNRDSATAAFGRAVERDPRYRIDEFIFPPEVTGLFADVRRQVKVVKLILPDTVSFGPAGGLTTVAYSSSFHDIGAEVVRPDGNLVRRLYAGPIGDSLQLRWDGRDSSGAIPTPGRYLLTVRSRDAAGEVLRILQVPLDYDVQSQDTLPHPLPPPDSMFRPERMASGAAVEAILGGLLAGVAAVALPSALAGGTDLSPARFGVAGVAGAAAVVGFVLHRPGKPIVANVVWNGEVRSRWQSDLAAVEQTNATRRAAIRFRLRFGAPITIDATPR